MTFAGFKKICDSTHHKAINPKNKTNKCVKSEESSKDKWDMRYTLDTREASKN